MTPFAAWSIPHPATTAVAACRRGVRGVRGVAVPGAAVVAHGARALSVPGAVAVARNG